MLLLYILVINHTPRYILNSLSCQNNVSKGRGLSAPAGYLATAMKHLSLFLAVLHQGILGLTSTSTNLLIVKSFKALSLFVWFLYQVFLFIKQTNVVLLSCLWHQSSALSTREIALTIVSCYFARSTLRKPPGFFPWFLTKIPLILFLKCHLFQHDFFHFQLH